MSPSKPHDLLGDVESLIARHGGTIELCAIGGTGRRWSAFWRSSNGDQVGQSNYKTLAGALTNLVRAVEQWPPQSRGADDAP